MDDFPDYTIMRKPEGFFKRHSTLLSIVFLILTLAIVGGAVWYSKKNMGGDAVPCPFSGEIATMTDPEQQKDAKELEGMWTRCKRTNLRQHLHDIYMRHIIKASHQTSYQPSSQTSYQPSSQTSYQPSSQTSYQRLPTQQQPTQQPVQEPVAVETAPQNDAFFTVVP